MSLSATGVRAAASLQPTPAPASSPQREAWNDLRRALRTDDLPAARQAYVSVVKNAPDGATFPRGSAFADLGKSLARGDVGAAKEAFKAVVREQSGADVAAPRPLLPVPVVAAGGVDWFA
jgi:hypothetical protein